MAFVFLDESGDLGFNPKKKNSKYFVITVLAVSNKKPLEKLVKKIHSHLRKKVKKLSGGILHAYKEKPATRKRILKLLSVKKCAIMSIYLNKSKVYTHLQEEKHVLYNYVTNILLDRIMKKKLVESSGIVFSMNTTNCTPFVSFSSARREFSRSDWNSGESTFAVSVT